jgi:hypothetical protein
MLLIVPTTPTIVKDGLAGPPRRICWPSALRPAKYLLAKNWSTTTTGGLSAVSPSLKNRPSTTGMRIAAK